MRPYSHDGAFAAAFSDPVLRKVFGCRLRIVGQRVLEDGAEFVVLEIALVQIRALLQHHDAESGRREFLGHHAAGGARADDQEIHGVGRPVTRHRLLPSGPS